MDIDETIHDLSLLLVRLIAGGAIAAHGAQKMFGAFGGPGIEGASQMLGSLGFDPPEKFARAASSAEIGSGTLIALGALGPVGPATLLSVMVSAIETVHKPKGFWNTSGGYEMNVMYMLIALLLATEGYGSYSVDAMLGVHERVGPTVGWLALAGGFAAAVGMLSQRRDTQQRQKAGQSQDSTTTGETEAETPAGVGD